MIIHLGLQGVMGGIGILQQECFGMQTMISEL